jgi:predicted metal-dependent hydrolase
MPNTPRTKNAPLYTEEEMEQQRPLVLLGCEQYNDGYFYEAHETLEDVWYRSPVPERTFLQAIIQLAAAFVHLARHEYPGTVRLLGHTLAKLDGVPDGFFGIDVERLRNDASKAREELIALGPRRFEEWDRSHIPVIRQVAEPRRRGP